LKTKNQKPRRAYKKVQAMSLAKKTIASKQKREKDGAQHISQWVISL
jgi:hypothetical protein